MRFFNAGSSNIGHWMIHRYLDKKLLPCEVIFIIQRDTFENGNYGDGQAEARSVLNLICYACFNIPKWPCLHRFLSNGRDTNTTERIKSTVEIGFQLHSSDSFRSNQNNHLFSIPGKADFKYLQGNLWYSNEASRLRLWCFIRVIRCWDGGYN